MLGRFSEGHSGRPVHNHSQLLHGIVGMSDQPGRHQNADQGRRDRLRQSRYTAAAAAVGSRASQGWFVFQIASTILTLRVILLMCIY